MLIGGWNLNGLARLRSGFPIAVPLGIGNSLDVGTPGGSLRPDMVQGVPLINPDWTRENAWRGVPYINPRAFAVPEPGQYGNAPRNLDAYHPWVRTLTPASSSASSSANPSAATSNCAPKSSTLLT